MRATRPFLVATWMALACVLGCSPPKPSVVPNTIVVVGADLQGLVVRTDLSVYNPHPVRLRINAVSGTLAFDRTLPVGSVEVPTTVQLPARSWQRAVLDLRLPWMNLPAVVASVRGRSTIPYTFDGQANIGGLVRVTVPFRMQGVLPASILQGNWYPWPSPGAGLTPLQWPIGEHASSPAHVVLLWPNPALPH